MRILLYKEDQEGAFRMFSNNEHIEICNVNKTVTVKETGEKFKLIREVHLESDETKAHYEVIVKAWVKDVD
jgi:hypothetical protein